MNARAVLLLSLAAIVPAGCTLKSPPERADVQAQALPGVQAPDSWRSGASPADTVEDAWLADFADPRLDALVAEALANNPDLLAAAARVEQAAAYVESAASALYPQVAAMGNVSGKDSSSGTVDFYGVFASWELDLWGKVRSGREAASLQLISVQLAQRLGAGVDGRHGRAGLVRRQRGAPAEGVADDMVAAAEKLVTLARERQRVGVGNEYDVSVAEASLATYRDAAEQLGLSFRQSVQAIETLVGRYPAAELDVPAALPEPARARARRPALGTARAAPRRDRSGTARGRRLLSGPGDQGGAAADHQAQHQLLQPVERPRAAQGTGRPGLGLRRPDHRAAVPGRWTEGRRSRCAPPSRRKPWRTTAAPAPMPSPRWSSALSASYALEAREPLLMQAVTENERALQFAETRYRVGSDDLRAVEQQQMRLFSAQSALLRVQSEQLVQRINLHLALGGNFGPPTS